MGEKKNVKEQIPRCFQTFTNNGKKLGLYFDRFYN